MAFHPPIDPKHLPEESPQRRGSSGLKSLAQAESLMQIALMLPSATLIGWGLGWWIDSYLHTRWITLAGLVVGMIAGMSGAIRMALAAGGKRKS